MTSFFRDNSAQTGGVSSAIYTGTWPNGDKYFYGDVYNDDGTHVSFDHINTITYLMGLGNDALSIDGSGMATAGNALSVNGGGGIDTLTANFAVVTTGFTITDSSIATSNISAANFEILHLTLGSGNDTLTLTGASDDSVALGGGNDSVSVTNATGYQTFNGEGGFNTLTVNNGSQSNGVTSNIYTSGSGASAYFYGNFYNVSNRTDYDHMHQLTYTMGSGADVLNLDGNGLAAAANTVSVEAGAGGDRLNADLHVLTTDMIMTDHSLTTSRVSLTGFDSYGVSLGDGNDTVTLTHATDASLQLNGGNDSVTIGDAIGYQTIQGAGGFNALSVDNSGQSVGVSSNIYATGSGVDAYFYGNFYNDTSRTDYDHMGALTYAMGNGANHLYFDGNSLANAATSVSVSSGASYDTLDADLHVLTTDIVMSDHSLITARVSLTGFDQYDLDFGSGNDSVTRTGASSDALRMGAGNDTVSIDEAHNYQAVDMGDGVDTLSVDNSDQTGNYGGYIYSGGGYFYGNLYNTEVRTDYDHTEKLTFKMGSGDSAVSVDGNSLAVAGNSLFVDAGAGHDSLTAGLGVVTTNITINGATLGTTNLTLNGFEVYNVTFGSGSDSVTLTNAIDDQLRMADGNDTVSITDAEGYQTVDGGNGIDRLTVNNAGQTNAVGDNIYSGGGYFYGNIYNESSRTDFDHIEKVSVVMGDGDDTVGVDGSSLVSGNASLSVDAAGGSDTLNANLAAAAGAITLTDTSLTATRLSLAHFETFNVTFSRFNDSVTLTGTANDQLRMGDGDDTVGVDGSSPVSGNASLSVDAAGGSDTLNANLA
ncbi:MAG: hypothetical protein JF615_04515, partial [Asticcacaulis sp.]|nr:hypothetical protein [Asticcacaulis sp.]